MDLPGEGGKDGRMKVPEGIVFQLTFAEILVSDSFTAVFSLAEWQDFNYFDFE